MTNITITVEILKIIKQGKYDIYLFEFKRNDNFIGNYNLIRNYCYIMDNLRNNFYVNMYRTEQERFLEPNINLFTEDSLDLIFNREPIMPDIYIVYNKTFVKNRYANYHFLLHQCDVIEYLIDKTIKSFGINNCEP